MGKQIKKELVKMEKKLKVESFDTTCDLCFTEVTTKELIYPDGFVPNTKICDKCFKLFENFFKTKGG